MKLKTIVAMLQLDGFKASEVSLTEAKALVGRKLYKWTTEDHSEDGILKITKIGLAHRKKLVRIADTTIEIKTTRDF